MSNKAQRPPEPRPDTIQGFPFRRRYVGAPSHDDFISYHIQVLEPTPEQVDVLVEGGWEPHAPEANADLENTVLFVQWDEDVAFAWLPEEEWAKTAIDECTFDGLHQPDCRDEACHGCA